MLSETSSESVTKYMFIFIISMFNFLGKSKERRELANDKK